MATTDDLKRIAAVAGVSIPAEDLERLALPLTALCADLERLRALVTEAVEPAFAPSLTPPADEASAEE